jgi:hypothetical protein
MVKETEEMIKDAADAINWLAAEFSYAKKLQEVHNQVLKDLELGHIKEALDHTKGMLRVYRMVARSERRTAREEHQIEDNLRKLEKLLPQEEQKQAKEILNQLVIADKTLAKLASFYRGEIKAEILEVKDEEKREAKLNALEERYPDKESLHEDAKKQLNLIKKTLSKLGEHIQELTKWISTNTVIVQKVDGWAKRLEELSA